MKDKQDERYKEAKKRVKELKEFYEHLAVYVAVNSFLFGIDLFSGEGWWFYWPLMGWGIAIVIHAVNTFAFQNFLSKDWEERKIQELMGEKPKRQLPNAPDDYFENT